MCSVQTARRGTKISIGQDKQNALEMFQQTLTWKALHHVLRQMLPNFSAGRHFNHWGKHFMMKNHAWCASEWADSWYSPFCNVLRRWEACHLGRACLISEPNRKCGCSAPMLERTDCWVSRQCSTNLQKRYDKTKARLCPYMACEVIPNRSCFDFEYVGRRKQVCQTCHKSRANRDTKLLRKTPGDRRLRFRLTGG